MGINRMRRIRVPGIAVLALAVTLIIIGMALSGSARAAPQGTAPPSIFAVQVRDPLFVFGDPVHIAAGERVESVVSFGGDVTVAGTVTRSIVSFGGDVLLLPTASVGAAQSETDTTVVSFGGTITARDGAQVTGGLERMRIGEDDWSTALDGPASNGGDGGAWVVFSFFWWLAQAALVLVLGVLAAALLPKQMLAVGRAVSARPGASLGWGALVFFIIVPAAAIVLLISVVGILVLIPAVVVVPIFYLLATVSVAALIAQRVLKGERRSNLMLATLLGVIGMIVISLIPFAGALALLIMALFGTGAAILAMLEWRRGRRMTSAPAPAGGPAGSDGTDTSPSLVAPPTPASLANQPLTGRADAAPATPAGLAAGLDEGPAVPAFEAPGAPTTASEAPTDAGNVTAVNSFGATPESETPAGIEEAPPSAGPEEASPNSSDVEGAAGQRPPEGVQ
ncbi:MAG TPA: hypothetical protein VFH61_15690 [Thermoleophilia bacterium]|nr:hypothetical protein [Thermoleophilia bacterium]